MYVKFLFVKLSPKIVFPKEMTPRTNKNMALHDVSNLVSE